MARKLSLTLSIVGFAGVALFTLPAMTAPIAVSKGVAAILPVDGGKLCRSGPLAAATEAGQFTEAPLFGGAALFIEGERWLDGEQW